MIVRFENVQREFFIENNFYFCLNVESMSVLVTKKILSEKIDEMDWQQKWISNSSLLRLHLLRWYRNFFYFLNKFLYQDV